MKKKEKSFATYSIQFWFDGSTIMCTETSNPKRGKELKDFNSYDMDMFAKRIAQSGLLDVEDKKMLKIFAKGLVRYLNNKLYI